MAPEHWNKLISHQNDAAFGISAPLPLFWGMAAMGTERWHAQLRLHGEVTSPLGTWPLPQHPPGEVLWGWVRGTERSSHGVAVPHPDSLSLPSFSAGAGAGTTMVATLSFPPLPPPGTSGAKHRAPRRQRGHPGKRSTPRPARRGDTNPERTPALGECATDPWHPRAQGPMCGGLSQGPVPDRSISSRRGVPGGCR